MSGMIALVVAPLLIWVGVFAYLAHLNAKVENL